MTRSAGWRGMCPRRESTLLLPGCYAGDPRSAGNPQAQVGPVLDASSSGMWYLLSWSSGVPALPLSTERGCILAWWVPGISRSSLWAFLVPRTRHRLQVLVCEPGGFWVPGSAAGCTVYTYPAPPGHTGVRGYQGRGVSVLGGSRVPADGNLRCNDPCTAAGVHQRHLTMAELGAAAGSLFLLGVCMRALL